MDQLANRDGDSSPLPDRPEPGTERYPGQNALLDWLDHADDLSPAALNQWLNSHYSEDVAADVVGDCVGDHLRRSWLLGVGHKLEEYQTALSRFDEFSRWARIPPDIVEMEFLARHGDGRHADHPSIAEYRERFRGRDGVLTALGQYLLGNGRYVRLEKLGEGGLGVVRRAYDTKLHRMVAIKSPCYFSLGEAETNGRLHREALLTAGFNHPSIVSVHEWTDESTCQPFYVMPVVGGQTLQQAINVYHASRAGSDERSARRKLNALLTHLIQICDAVAYAHKHDVAHRDLKPANVKVGEFGETIVLDWGLSRPIRRRPCAAGSSPQESAKLSSERDTVGADGATEGKTRFGGTPGYVAPEQATGDHSDERSDIFSLGGILYCILVGRSILPDKAFDSDAQFQAWLAAPSFPRPSQLRLGLPKSLEAICLKMLSLDASQRYPSVIDARNDLTRFLADEPVEARREPWYSFDRVLRVVRRHRSWTIAGLAVLLIVIGSVALQAFAAKGRLRQSQRAGYASDMKLASQEWRDGRTDPLVRLLAKQVPDGSDADWRHWEWRHLSRRITSQTIVAQTDRAVASSRLATWTVGAEEHFAVSIDERLFLFDGPKLREMGRHSSSIRDLVVSPNAHWLAAASEDSDVSIWDLRSGRRQALLRSHIQAVNSVSFSTDGKYLVTAADDSTWRVWTVPGFKQKQVLRVGTEAIRAARFLPDRPIVILTGSALPDGNYPVLAWDIDADKQVQQWTLPALPITLVTDAKEPVWGAWCGDGRFRAWHIDEPDKKKLDLPVEAGDSPVGSLNLAEQELISAGKDGTVKIYDVRTGKLARRYRGHSDAITGLVDAPLRNEFYTASMDGTVRRWDRRLSDQEPLLRHALKISNARFTPGGERLVTGSFDRTVKLWNASDLSLIRSFGEQTMRRHPETGLPLKAESGGGHNGLVMDVAPSPSGHWIASAGLEDKRVILWNAEAGAVERTFAHPLQVSSVIFLNTDERLVSGDWGGVVHLWDASNGKPIRKFTEHTDQVTSLAADSTGRLIASGSADGSAIVRRIDDGRLIARLIGHGKTVRTVAFSPNGDWIATGGDDATIRLWRVRGSTVAEQPTHVLLGHRDTINRVVFSPDGQRLASASGGGLGDTIRLWDIETGQETASLDGRSNVAFSPNGNYLVVGGPSNGLRLLDGRTLNSAETGMVVALAEALKGAVRRLASEKSDRVEPDGGLKALGYATSKAQAPAKDKGDPGESDEPAVQTLYVPLSFSAGHFVLSEADDAAAQAAASAAKDPPLAPRKHRAVIRLGSFTLILKDGRRIAADAWADWPTLKIESRGEIVRESSRSLLDADRDLHVLTWKLPDDVGRGPFQVQMLEFNPISVPDVKLGPLK